MKPGLVPTLAAGRGVQLELFPDIDIRPTPADVERGATLLRQCASCGLLVAAPDCGVHRAVDRLGPCPRCGSPSWWRQERPAVLGGHIVGPFYNAPDEAGPDGAAA